MDRLCRTLAALEESLVALERRGISLRAHAARQDPPTGRLPVYHVFLGTRRTLVHHAASELDDFLAAAGSSRPARKLDVDDRPGEPTPPAPTATAGDGQAAARCTSSSCTRSARSTTSSADLARDGLRDRQR